MDSRVINLLDNDGGIVEPSKRLAPAALHQLGPQTAADRQLLRA